MIVSFFRNGGPGSYTQREKERERGRKGERGGEFVKNQAHGHPDGRTN